MQKEKISKCLRRPMAEDQHEKLFLFYVTKLFFLNYAHYPVSADLTGIILIDGIYDR